MSNERTVSNFTAGNQTNTTVNGIAANRAPMETAAYNIGRGISKAVKDITDYFSGPSEEQKSAQHRRAIRKSQLNKGLSNPKFKDPNAIAEFVNQRLGELLALLVGKPEDIAEAKRKCYNVLETKYGRGTKKLDDLIAKVPELQQVHALHKINQEKDEFSKAYQRARVFQEKLAKIDPNDARLAGDWDQFDPLMFDHVAQLREQLSTYLDELIKQSELSGNKDKQALARKLHAAARKGLARFAQVPTVEALAKEGVQIPAKPMSALEAEEAKQTFIQANYLDKKERTRVLKELASKGFVPASWDLSQALIRGDRGMFDVEHDDVKARYFLQQAKKQADTPYEKRSTEERIARAPQPGIFSAVRNAYIDYIKIPRLRWVMSFFDPAPTKDLAEALKISMQEFLRLPDSNDKPIIEEVQKLQKNMGDITLAMEMFHHLLMRINTDALQGMKALDKGKLDFADFYENRKSKIDKRVNMFEALIKFLDSREQVIAAGADLTTIINMGKETLKEVNIFHNNVEAAARKYGYQPRKERERLEL